MNHEEYTVQDREARVFPCDVTHTTCATNPAPAPAPQRT